MKPEEIIFKFKVELGKVNEDGFTLLCELEQDGERMKILAIILATIGELIKGLDVTPEEMIAMLPSDMKAKPPTEQTSLNVLNQIVGEFGKISKN